MSKGTPTWSPPHKMMTTDDYASKLTETVNEAMEEGDDFEEGGAYSEPTEGQSRPRRVPKDRIEELKFTTDEIERLSRAGQDFRTSTTRRLPTLSVMRQLKEDSKLRVLIILTWMSRSEEQSRTAERWYRLSREAGSSETKSSKIEMPTGTSPGCWMVIFIDCSSGP